MTKKWNKILWGVLFAIVLGFSLYRKIQAVDVPVENTTPVSENQNIVQETVDVVQIPESTVVDDGSFVQQDSVPEIAIEETIDASALSIKEDGSYNSKEDVSLYIHTYRHLPENYITKKEAQALGWTGGSLEHYAPGKSIGGDSFGNREGVLPKQNGRTYTECDIDTRGKKSRGAKRIVYSNDGFIYYTEDHYESFETLYGEE